MRVGVMMLAFLLLIPVASAAQLSGNVYDFSLGQITAIVEINTTPAQKLVARRAYSFQVEPGTYKLTAKQVDGGSIVAYAEENITIESNGSFSRDLILFPEFDINETEFQGPGVGEGDFNYWEPVNKALPILALLSILIILWALNYSHKAHANRQKTTRWEKDDLQLDEEARKILDFIDKRKRTTQKEINKEFGHSAAKISLILTELEEKGLIRKIKRGRGNVIIRN